MPERSKIGLGSIKYTARLHQPTAPNRYLGRAKRSTKLLSPNGLIVDVRISKPLASKLFLERSRLANKPPTSNLAVDIVRAQPFARPSKPKQERSVVLKRQTVARPTESLMAQATRPAIKYPKMHFALVSMALIIFCLGVIVSLQTVQTNHTAASQVEALSKASGDAPATSDANSSSSSKASTPPSTAKLSSSSIADYVVGPTMPRYLNIPKLGVHARVLSLGILSSGALATPSNVYDVGWYNESSLPGQPGAMLIDGHVSSWTAHGVFYGIKTLVAGDQLQIVKGDGTVINYQVVSSQVFSHTSVNMQSAVTPINPNAPGLNLITCTGDVIPGTNEFNERVLVYAEQI